MQHTIQRDVAGQDLLPGDRVVWGSKQSTRIAWSRGELYSFKRPVGLIVLRDDGKLIHLPSTKNVVRIS